MTKAFATTLPAALAEKQMACLRRYGAAQCEAFAIDTRDAAVTIFAGVMRRPFPSKKAAQNSLGLNVKGWGIQRDSKYSRTWLRELTVDEYAAEFSSLTAKPAPSELSIEERIARRVEQAIREQQEARERDAMTDAERQTRRANRWNAPENVAARAAQTEKEREKEELRNMQTAEMESKKAARWALDPEKCAEQEREHAEARAMLAEDRLSHKARSVQIASEAPKRRPCKRPRVIL